MPAFKEKEITTPTFKEKEITTPTFKEKEITTPTFKEKEITTPTFKEKEITTPTFKELELDPNIFKALTACDYTTPTAIQSQTIPHVLKGKDIVASAQTGTGKTAAFVLPALHRLTLTKGSHHPRILILTPTRELATQITQASIKYGKYLNFNIISLLGGMPYRQQLRQLSRPVDIIVATPGRLLDHMQSGRLQLGQIEMLVLDEADRMLDMGFIDDVKIIANATPDTRQTLLFSATVDKKLHQVVRYLLKDPVTIDLSEKITPALIAQELYMADHTQHKNRLLIHLLNEKGIYKAIIFSGTKINADKLATDLRHQGYEAAALHGDLKQNVRTRTVEQLRSGKIQFLIATDVAARGINITDITHVINFDLPKFPEDYVHRIGRTGRAGKEGTAISLAVPGDARHIQRIEHYINQKIPRKTIAGLEPTKTADYSASEKRKGKSNNSSGFAKKRSFSSDRTSDRKFADRSNRSEKFDSNFDSKRSSKSGGFGAKRTFKSSDGFDSKRAPRSDRSDGFGAKRTFKSDGFDPKRAPRSDRSDGFGAKRTFKSDGFDPKRAPRSDRSDGFGAKRTFKSDGFDAKRAPRSSDRSDGFGAKRTFKSDGFDAKRAPRSSDRSDGFGAKRTFKSDGFDAKRTPRSSDRSDGFGAKRTFKSDDRSGDRFDSKFSSKRKAKSTFGSDRTSEQPKRAPKSGGFGAKRTFKADGFDPKRRTFKAKESDTKRKFHLEK